MPAVPQLRSILYVDDNRQLQEVVRIVLHAMAELVVHTCSSGPDGLKIAADVMPDLILLDVEMPDMDGPTTLSALRKLPATKNIPVMFITAKAREQDVDWYTSLGVIGVIAKPFEPLILAERVLQLWAMDHRCNMLTAQH